MDDLDLGKLAYLELWDFKEWNKDDVVVWQSDDQGATWKDVSGEDCIKWLGDDNLAFTYDEITNAVWLQIEVSGYGESNVVKLYNKDGLTVGDTGGDRTGADRIIGNDSGDDPKESSPNDAEGKAKSNITPAKNKKLQQRDNYNSTKNIYNNVQNQNFKMSSFSPAFDTVSAETKEEIMGSSQPHTQAEPSDTIQPNNSSKTNIALIVLGCITLILLLCASLIRFTKLVNYKT